MRPASQRDLELLSMPTISSQMPLHFENGNVWRRFQGKCQGCGRTFPDEALRGHIAKWNGRLFSLEAIGACTDCRLLSPFVYRLHDDMSISGPEHGRWCTWKAHKPSLLQRIGKVLGINKTRAD